MRGHNQGSIFRRSRDGRWVAAVTMPDGSRPTVSAATRDEAKVHLRELIRRRDAGVVNVSPNQTLAAFLDGWLLEMRSQVGYATWRRYEQVVRVHINPVLGRVALSRLAVHSVDGWLAEAVRVSHPRTVSHMRAVLRRALSDAERSGLVQRNVASLSRPVRVRPQAKPALDAGQVHLLIEGTAEDRLGPLWHVATTTGLRSSELLGLAWEDIHEGYLTVRHSLQRQKGEWVLAPTKTEKSARVVPLTAGARDALRRHRLAMAEERTPTWRFHGLVFTTPRGEPMYAWHVLEALYAAEDRLGLPRVSFHGLRHSYTSIMATEGADRRHLADMLGHSTTRLTDDLYRHVAPPSLERLRDLMERAVEG